MQSDETALVLRNEIEDRVGRRLDSISSFRDLHRAPEFVELFRARAGNPDHRDSARLRRGFLSDLSELLNAVLPTSDTQEALQIREFVDWVNGELAQSAPEVSDEFEDLEYGRIEIESVLSYLAHLDTIEEKVRLITLVLDDQTAVSSLWMDTQTFPRNDARSVISSVGLVGGRFDLDLSEDDESLLESVLDSLQGSRVEEVVDKFVSTIEELGDSSRAIRSGDSSKDIEPLAEADADILMDMSPDSVEASSRFFVIRQFLSELRIHGGKRVWPDNKLKQRRTKVRRYDLALLLYHLSQTGGLEVREWAAYGSERFVWSDLTPVDNRLLNTYRSQNDRRVGTFEYPSRVTDLIDQMYGVRSTGM